MKTPTMPQGLRRDKNGVAYEPKATLDGIALTYTRRRYGNRTYTWVQALLDDVWTDLGDPWPSIHVPQNQIRMVIARLKGHTTCGYVEGSGE